MYSQTFWNEVGSQKNFEDPLYMEKLQPFVDLDSKIVEYGCGYGRLMNQLKNNGYINLIGFDFAPNMIKRGKSTYPDLDLFSIEESGSIPLKTSSCDAVIMSTILCCVVDKDHQKEIIDEAKRVLKIGGVLYLSDFLLCNHSRYVDKYQEGYKSYNEWGVYTTDEGITVRHHSTRWITQLLEDLDIQWFEQFDFKTMNNNSARTCHCIAKNIA